jgi:hypothetical protein
VRLAFGAALALASVATVDKYLGLVLTAVYALVVVAAAPALLDLVGLAHQHLTERQALWLALATLVALAVVFAVVYPHANAHTATAGSDRDDAADLGARALLDGRYPYAERTYLGGGISQLPGGLVLAAPFVAIGRSAYAAFCWLPLLFLLLRRLAGDARRPLLLLWLALLLSPVLVRELVTGGDLIANCVAVMLAAWLVAVLLDRSPLLAGLAAVGLGLALSWRLNFVFVVPPLLALVWRRTGAGAALAVAALAAAAFAAVTLPFYLAHRDEFTPLGASNHLQGFDGTIPGGARAVVLAGLALSVALALRAAAIPIGRVFAQTAVVQAFFVVAVVALASAHASTLELGPLVPGYGLPVLLFAVGALAALRPVVAA